MCYPYSIMITLNSVTKKVGTRLLFEDVTVTFNQGCYGLTGPNGAGKSTLLKIIMGTVEPTSGSVSLPSKVGFLRQNIEDFAEQKVIDTVIMGNKRLWDALTERERLYERRDDRRSGDPPGRARRDHRRRRWLYR